MDQLGLREMWEVLDQVDQQDLLDQQGQRDLQVLLKTKILNNWTDLLI